MSVLNDNAYAGILHRDIKDGVEAMQEQFHMTTSSQASGTGRLAGGWAAASSSFHSQPPVSSALPRCGARRALRCSSALSAHALGRNQFFYTSTSPRASLYRRSLRIQAISESYVKYIITIIIMYLI